MMKAQQNDVLSYSETLKSNMMTSNSNSNAEEIAQLRFKIREMEDEINTLRNGMDAMVSDIAISEALAKETQEAKERAEHKCSELVQQIQDMSLELQEQNQLQANRGPWFQLGDKAFPEGVQIGGSSEPAQADIDASLESQFQQREAELLEQCRKAEIIAQDFCQQCETAESRLQEAETRIDALQQQNQKQLVDMKEMAAKQEKLESHPGCNSSCQSEKIDQLQSLVKYYKGNSERLSREFKVLKKQTEAQHSVASLPPSPSGISSTVEKQLYMASSDGESEG